MNKADLVELKSLAAPPVGVKDMVHTLCLILGEPEANASSWSYGKKVLGNSSLLKQMQTIDPTKLEASQVTKAKELLSKYNFDQLKKVSAASAGLHKWCTNVLDGVNQWFAWNYADLEFHYITHHQGKTSWFKHIDSKVAIIPDWTSSTKH